MKRYITFVLAAMSLLGMASCSTDSGIAAPDGEGQMALRFESSSMTRADGVADLNENLIKTIDCYFYPSSADENTQAVWHQKFTFGTDGAGVNSQASVTDILMPSGEMNAIFGSGTTGTGKIYAIANYAGGDALPTSGANTTVAKLKDMVVTAAWLDDSSKFQKQASFVMDSEMVTINKAEGNTITGSVPLYRTAAKVELSITSVAESVQNSDGTWWVPAITVADDGTVSQANVTMYNARTAAGVGGTAQPYNAATSLTLQNYGFCTSAAALYKQTNPFYTYPHSWSTDDEEAYLLLVVYWQQTDKESEDDTDYNLVGDPEPCYYEIPIGLADNSEIKRNNFYQIGINVGTLGSFVKEDPMQLTPSYMVVDWGTGKISANIKGQQYLVVEENKVNIYNENENYVTYSSSHPVTVEIVSVTKPDYRGQTASQFTYTPSNNNKTTVTPTQVTINSKKVGNTNPFTVTLDGNKIKLSHTLVNDNISNMFDYVPYTITVNVTNEAGLTQQITYKQYPAVYIENHQNSSQTNVDKWSNGGTGTDGAGFGYVMVNSLYNNRTNAGNDNNTWYTVESFDNNSYNPNMYIVTTTALDSSLASKYVLSDSREETTYTDSQIGFESVRDVNNKNLKKYRPTRTDREDYLSPKFRIASAYGQLGSQNLPASGAKNRCAAYQEDGYPAGRWRLPTTAELEYIAMLCAKGALPISLFGGSYYWSATQTYSISTSNGTVNAAGQSEGYLRCVYDDWYWGSDQLTDRTKYMWGDESTTAELNATLNN